MAEDFTHKQIHSVVWLIAIIVVTVIIAGIAIVLFSGGSIEHVPVATDNLTQNLDTTASVTPVQPQNTAPTNSVTDSSVPSSSTALDVPGAIKLITHEITADKLMVEIRVTTGSLNSNLTRAVVLYDPRVVGYEDFDHTDSVYPIQVNAEATPGRIVISRGALGDADPYDANDAYTGVDGLFATLHFSIVQRERTTIDFDKTQTVVLSDDARASQIPLTFTPLTIDLN